MIGYLIRSIAGRSPLRRALRQHFGGVELSQIVTAARDFPVTSRVDVDRALTQLLPEKTPGERPAGARLLGVHSQMNHETPTDQAIEFPLPDDEGRRKLVRLYSRGLEVPAAVMEVLVRRTDGASPAFIKELMRRSAQFQIERGGGTVLLEAAVDSAIDEMVFVGGALNLKLLGGPGVARSGDG